MLWPVFKGASCGSGKGGFGWLTERFPRLVVCVCLISLWAVGAAKAAGGAERARVIMALPLLAMRTSVILVDDISVKSF